MMPQRLFITSHLREAFALAYGQAAQLGHEEVTPAHLLLGILQHGTNMAAQILLYSCRVSQPRLEEDLATLLPPTKPCRPPGAPSWSSRDERILALAATEAQGLGHEHYGCQHVLLAFLRDQTSMLPAVLARHGVHFDDVRRDVVRVYNDTMVWAAANSDPT